MEAGEQACLGCRFGPPRLWPAVLLSCPFPLWTKPMQRGRATWRFWGEGCTAVTLPHVDPSGRVAGRGISWHNQSKQVIFDQDSLDIVPQIDTQWTYSILSLCAFLNCNSWDTLNNQLYQNNWEYNNPKSSNSRQKWLPSPLLQQRNCTCWPHSRRGMTWTMADVSSLVSLVLSSETTGLRFTQNEVNKNDSICRLTYKLQKRRN